MPGLCTYCCCTCICTLDPRLCKPCQLMPVFVPHCVCTAAAPTGILMPAPGPFSGTYTLMVDESGKKASWTLELCDTPAYIASHLHTVSHSLAVFQSSCLAGWPETVSQFGWQSLSLAGSLSAWLAVSQLGWQSLSMRLRLGRLWHSLCHHMASVAATLALMSARRE
jgi:hypothetical protein